MSWIDNIIGVGGVYKITNMVNGKFYIGSSIDIKRRFKDRIKTLNLGKRNNPKLINSWIKYGKDKFRFDVILLCEPFELLRYEQFFLDTLNPYFNICKIAGNTLGRPTSDKQKNVTSSMNLGKKRPQEVKDKIRLSLLGVNHTEERKKKISATMKNVPWTQARRDAQNRRVKPFHG